MKTTITWILWAGVLLSVASCGKSKPEEVAELRLDGKLIELKPDAFSALNARVETLCTVSNFVEEWFSSTEIGDMEKVIITSSMVLDGSLESMTRKYEELNSGKRVPPETLSEIKASLDALRSGWQVASIYISDSAPESSVSSFKNYSFHKVTLTPKSIGCYTEIVIPKDKSK